jgi:hypothetical protein
VTATASVSRRAGKNGAHVLAAAGFFCLLCGYYMLRPMREALALEVGVQYNSCCSTRAAVSRALLPIYWWSWAARRAAGCCGCVSRRSSACSSCWRRVASDPHDRTLAFVYFVALTSANLY